MHPARLSLSWLLLPSLHGRGSFAARRRLFHPQRGNAMIGWSRLLAGAMLLAATTGCFRQVVQTGRAPSTTVVQQNWVSTWVFGLVAAQPIDARAQCPSGVATVETHTSFANGLVGGLTLGIWTPQSVRITCASGTAALPAGTEVLQVAADASDAVFEQVMQAAADRSAQLAAPVAVQFVNDNTVRE